MGILLSNKFPGETAHGSHLLKFPLYGTLVHLMVVFKPQAIDLYLVKKHPCHLFSAFHGPGTELGIL